MVESSGDGIIRNIQYGKFRSDLPAVEGHTQELVSMNGNPKYFDDYDNQPLENPECNTLLKHF